MPERYVAQLRARLESEAAISAVTRMEAVYLGPGEVLVAADVAMADGLSGAEVALSLARTRAAICTELPVVARLYLTPVVVRSVDRCPRSGLPFVVPTTTTPQEVTVSRIIVIQFVSLDGVIHDPDGADGSPHGGWAFRHGPEAIAGDKFALGEVLDTGALLLGRRTWEKFAGLWPTREDEFSAKMNAIPKLSPRGRSTTWAPGATPRSSTAISSPRPRRGRPSATSSSPGSATVAHALIGADLVDEYRLLVFPTLAGDGTRLFESPRPSTAFTLASARSAGPAALLVYSRAA